MESLLPYYERELTFLRRLSHDFARRYPKVASRLLLSGEACDDPHIERLIESFAFLTGRIHKKLDDDFPELTDSLLQVLYPQFLRPFPSTSIAHFDLGGAAGQLTKAAFIPRNTLLTTRPVRGVPCRFRTAYDVNVWPLQIVNAAYENVFDLGSLRTSRTSDGRTPGEAIRIDLAAVSDTVGLDAPQFGLGKLRFYLNGDTAVVASLREAIFSKAICVWVSTPTSSQKIPLPLTAIQSVGFADNEALLDQDARSHHAYRLLLEYFVFPEKFNFVDLDLSALSDRLPLHTRTIEIRIGLAERTARSSPDHLLDRISKENFVLGCTPVVNLFRQHPEPIRMTDTATAYPIIVDSRRPQAYEIYDIRRVFRVGQTGDDDEVREFRPFYSLRHAEPHDGPAQYWHASYVDEGGDDNFTMELSLVDSALRPQSAQPAALSLDLTCTNRDLPSQLPFGLPDGDLFIQGGSVAKTIRLLRKPTKSYRFPRGRGAQWRLVSHLALNHLSLSGPEADAIQEILTLYDITRSGTNRRQISGIVGIEQRTTMARITGNPFPTMARGIEVRITVDETHYAGIGIFMFAQLLDHFFGLYVHTNSFTQLVVVSKQSGEELIKCPARSGVSTLV